MMLSPLYGSKKVAQAASLFSRPACNLDGSQIAPKPLTKLRRKTCLASMFRHVDGCVSETAERDTYTSKGRLVESSQTPLLG